MFSGTVRYNLNPFGGEAADSDMWAALQQAGLKETVSSLAVSSTRRRHCMRRDLHADDPYHTLVSEESMCAYM